MGLYADLPNMFLTDLLELFMKCYICKMPPNVILLTKSRCTVMHRLLWINAKWTKSPGYNSLFPYMDLRFFGTRRQTVQLYRPGVRFANFVICIFYIFLVLFCDFWALLVFRLYICLIYSIDIFMFSITVTKCVQTPAIFRRAQARQAAPELEKPRSFKESFFRFSFLGFFWFLHFFCFCQ